MPLPLPSTANFRPQRRLLPSPERKTKPKCDGYRVREGDAYWMRIMHAKEQQWRFMNVIALHEINLFEHRACAELDALSAHLDQIEADTSRKAALVATCRAARAKQLFDNVAKPVLCGLADMAMGKRMEYERACDALFEAAKAIRLHQGRYVTAQGIVREEFSTLRRAALRYGRVALPGGMGNIVGICDALETLATLVATEELNAVVCAAKALRDATEAKEREKNLLAVKVVRAKGRR